MRKKGKIELDKLSLIAVVAAIVIILIIWFKIILPNLFPK